MTTDERDPSLESGEIDRNDGQPAPAPVVVIQYRTRGLPWYFVLPLLVFVPLGAVAIYHRVSTRAALYAPAPVEIALTRNTEAAPATADAGLTRAVLKPNGPVVPIPDAAFPLALNSHPLTRIPDALSQAHGESLRTEASPEPAAEAAVSPSPTNTPAVSSPDTASTKPDQSTAPRPAGKTVVSTNAKATASPALPETSSAVPPASEPIPPAPAPGLVDQAPLPKRPPAIGFTPPSESFDPTNPFLTPLALNTPDLSKPSKPRDASVADSDDEVDQVDAEPIPPAVPTREELLDDIAAEAARKRGELKENQKIKENARFAMAMERRAKIEEEREDFRTELRKVLDAHRKGMGDEIDALYNRYNGGNVDPAVQAAANYVLSRGGGRLTREGKVKLLRRYGVPEPIILDFLSNEIHRSVNSLHGPRNANEVRVLAAKQLLAIKPSKNQPAAAKPPQPASKSRQGVAASWPPAPWAAGNR